MLDPVLVDEPLEGIDRLLLFALGERRVDDRRIEHLARRVDDGHLAAVRVAGVEPHCDKAFHGRLHEKRPEVEGKVVNRRLVCRVGQHRPELALHAGRKKPVVAVFGRRSQKCHRRRAGLYDASLNQLHRFHPVQIQRDLQIALLLAPVEGQHLMALELRDGLMEVVIKPVNGVLVLLRGLTLAQGAFLHPRAQALAKLRVVGNPLGDDVARAGKRIFDRLHTQIGI